MRRAATVAFVCAAIVAFAAAHGIVLLTAAVPVVAASFFRWTRPAAAVWWLSWAAVAAALAAPIRMTFYADPLHEMMALVMPTGIALCLFAAALLVVGRTPIPVALGILTLAALRRDAPTFDWAVVAAAAALAVALLQRSTPLRTALFLGGAAASGVVIAWSLPRAQPYVENSTARLFEPSRDASSGLSDTSRLGSVERLALSPTVVLRAWSDRPQNLRLHVFTSFDGKQWGVRTQRRALEPTTDWVDDLPGETYGAPGGDTLTRIVSETLPPGAVAAPAGTVRIRHPRASIQVDDFGVLSTPGPPGPLYAVVNGRDETAVGDLLAVPDVDPRLRDLAASMEGSVEERIRRTSEYLQTTCTYSLNVGAFRTDDPIAEFLFEKRRGYCEYFATSTVLLLRLQGVPARYVTGLSVRESSFEGGHYVVREADAHAWAEAYVPGRGWVEVDATPPAQYEAMRAPVRGVGLWERIKGWAAELAALLEQGGVWAVLARIWREALAAIATIVAAVLLWRRRRRRPKRAVSDLRALAPELRELIRDLDRRWSRAGRPRPASRGLREHLAPGDEAATIVEAVYRCVYGGASIESLRARVRGGG